MCVFGMAVGALKKVRRGSERQAPTGARTLQAVGVGGVQSMQLVPVGVLLHEEPYLVLERVPYKAVDEGVQAAVGEGGQVDDVCRQRIVVPERPLRVPPQQVDAHKHVLR